MQAKPPLTGKFTSFEEYVLAEYSQEKCDPVDVVANYEAV
jgi:hypothetical protein